MQCILQSAVRRNVPANVLLAIGQHEAGKEGMAIANTNGSFDLGRAGINTVHLKELAKHGVKPEVARHYLTYDGCYNYDMAAYLIKKHLNRCKAGQEFWTCVANYHSTTEGPNRKYRALIMPLSRAWARYLSTNYEVKDYPK